MTRNVMRCAIFLITSTIVIVFNYDSTIQDRCVCGINLRITIQDVAAHGIHKVRGELHYNIGGDALNYLGWLLRVCVFRSYSHGRL